jgi:hypothetical protein
MTRLRSAVDIELCDQKIDRRLIAQFADDVLVREGALNSFGYGSSSLVDPSQG